MYVVEKQRGGHTYIDYFHNERFSLKVSAIKKLNKMFEEQKQIGSNPEWLNEQHTEFIYTFQDTKIKAYVKEEKKCTKHSSIMCYSIKN